MILFLVSYLICRYVVFDIHGMKSGPAIIAVVGVIALIVSYILKMRTMTTLSTMGYIFSFILGAIFKSDEPQIYATNVGDMFTIWLISYLILIAIGLGVDIVRKVRKHH